LFTPKGDKVLFFGSEKNIFLSKGFFFEKKAKTKPEQNRKARLACIMSQ
jgi:hypothetical protein